MSDPIHVEELATYLACPRQYEFEFISELKGNERRNQEEFRQMLRDSICTGLAFGLNSEEDPHEVAQSSLDSHWDSYVDDIDYHSDHQVAMEKNRAEAAVAAYFDSVGEVHLDRIEQADDQYDIQVVGPDISLTSSINGQQLLVDVDYLMADSHRVTAVRLSDTNWGSRIPWENKTEVVADHINDGEYRPRMVGTVFGARVVEEALDALGGDGTVGEMQYLSVMETTFESAEGCEAQIDTRPMRPYLEDSRRDIDDAISWLCSNMGDTEYWPKAVFDEQDYWSGSFEQVVENECRYCSYVSGCQETIRREVQFNV